MFIFNCYLLTCFILLKFTENIKKRENWNEQVFVPICILVWIILMLDFFLSFYFYALSKYDISSHVFKHVIKCDNFNKIIFGMWLRIFRRRTLLRVTLVSVKESWGIRILLNIMRSTQIFNEILYKSSYLSQSGFKTKMLKINNDKTDF